MYRPLRIEFSGAVYHVTARGNEKRDIFSDDKDFKKMVSLIEQYAARLRVRVYCFALMSNHYHMMIETPDANLTAFMHNLQSHYSNYFNGRHDRAGHLFQGRYKALLVDRESSCFCELSRYVHLNPVRAGIAEKPGNWKWSSYRAYYKKNRIYPWVETQDLLSRFGKSRAEALKKYRKYVIEGINKEPRNPLDDAVAQLIIGTEEFVEEIKTLISETGKNVDREIAQGKLLSRWSEKQAEEKIAAIAEILKENPENVIKKGSYKNTARKITIMCFYNHSGWRVSKIGAKFGISGAAVCKIRERQPGEMKKNPQLAKDLKKAERFCQ